MANPTIALKPILVIEPANGKFTISAWHAPSGIWHHTGSDHIVDTFFDATAMAGPMAQALGAAIAINVDFWWKP